MEADCCWLDAPKRLVVAAGIAADVVAGIAADVAAGSAADVAADLVADCVVTC